MIDDIIELHPIGAVAFELKRQAHPYAQTLYAVAHACVTGDEECTPHDLERAFAVLVERPDNAPERTEQIAAMRRALAIVEPNADASRGNLATFAACWRWAQDCSSQLSKAERQTMLEEASLLEALARNAA